ncbi:hypothetical protein AAFN90_00935 [Erwiniaceae bacterium CAU 1747]
MTILIKDSLRRAVETASNGSQTVLYTVSGVPSFVNIIPKFNLQDISDEIGSGVHPAFVINGKTVPEIFVGTYAGSLINGQLVSRPDVPQITRVSYDDGITYARAAGPGWHRMTNIEFSAIGLMCNKLGVYPRGNTNYGRSSDNISEVGRRVDGMKPGTESGVGTILNGSGPVAWRHNGEYAGISDLAGNIWESVSGLRFCAGEIQIMADNNAASSSVDNGVTSTAWRAISGADGSLLTPTFTGSIVGGNYVATTAGSVRVGDSPAGGYVLKYGDNISFSTVKDISTSPISAAATQLLKRHMLLPLNGLATNDGVFYQQGMESAPLRGGSFSNGDSGGLNALLANRGRNSMISENSGLRPVYYNPASAT